MRQTFHLVPAAVWAAADPDRPYTPASLVEESFVHCTDGDVELLRTAQRHYRTDPRPFLAITLDLERVGSPWRIDDPAGMYPHIHGPVDRAAVMAVAPIRREPDGAFIALGPPDSHG